jgi:subtilisin family serine protease
VFVASAHNFDVRSYPWRFSSVVSVASHDGHDPYEFLYNPDPPVEVFARGMDVEVAWLGGTRITACGNSFATAHVTGICALVLAKHPGLTPFQVKAVLRETADNMVKA